MSGGLAALLDDIAAMAKLAAASIDDVATIAMLWVGGHILLVGAVVVLVMHLARRWVNPSRGHPGRGHPDAPASH